MTNQRPRIILNATKGHGDCPEKLNRRVTMKKILAIVLALMLALTMCAGAVAETENPVAGKKVA